MRKRATHWDKIKKEIRPRFAAIGLLNICELQWETCLRNKYLSFAHSLRRSAIDKYKSKGDVDGYEEKMREVIRTCVNCHATLDANKRDITYDIVRRTIGRRKRQP